MKPIISILLVVPVLVLFGCQTPLAAPQEYSGRLESVQISAAVGIPPDRYPIALFFNVSTPWHEGPLTHEPFALAIGQSRNIEFRYPDSGDGDSFTNWFGNSWLDCHVSLSLTKGSLRLWTETAVKDVNGTQPSEIRVFLQNDKGEMVEQSPESYFRKLNTTS